MGCGGSKNVPVHVHEAMRRKELPSSTSQLSSDSSYHASLTPKVSVKLSEPEAETSLSLAGEVTEPVTEDDHGEVKLIEGEYKEHRISYDVDPDVAPATQAGVGTWGTKERFEDSATPVPGPGTYNLPELTGTDTTGAAFSMLTGERFEDLANGVPGVGSYDLPPLASAPTNGAFSAMTAPRFEDSANGAPGVGTYDLPEITGTDPCPAVFGRDGQTRGEVPEDETQDIFLKYDVEPCHDKVKPVKSKMISFSRNTSKRFTTSKKENDRMYDAGSCHDRVKTVKSKAVGFSRKTSTRFVPAKKVSSRMYDTRKSWSKPKGGGATFGSRSSNRFGTRKGY